eukprot:634622-Hanusia_phi.AAC.1
MATMLARMMTAELRQIRRMPTSGSHASTCGRLSAPLLPLPARHQLEGARVPAVGLRGVEDAARGEETVDKRVAGKSFRSLPPSSAGPQVDAALYGQTRAEEQKDSRLRFASGRKERRGEERRGGERRGRGDRRGGERRGDGRREE